MKKMISIEGMMCQHCTMAVTEALNGLEGVNSVDIDLENGMATVDFDGVEDEKFKSAIQEAGYEVKNIK